MMASEIVVLKFSVPFETYLSDHILGINRFKRIGIVKKIDKIKKVF